MSRTTEDLRPHHDAMVGNGKADMIDKIRFMRAGLNTRRYHQRYTAEIDTVGKHSAGVAGFILLIYGEALPPSSLLAAAICHDLPEAVTGDIPSPAKRSWTNSAKAALEETETYLLKKHDLDYTLSTDEQRLLKVADVFDGLMFCIEEVNRGNREVDTVGDTYATYMSSLTFGSSRETHIANILNQMWQETKR